MPIAPRLQRFVEQELAGSAALIRSALRDIQSSLQDRGGQGDLGERAMRAELATQIVRLAPIFQSSFVESLATRVRAELTHEQDGRGPPPLSGFAGLTLMDESRVEIDIEISRATEVIDAAAEWELRELQTFTSTLIGQDHVSAESNPLRPTLYAAALWDAACSVHSGQAQRTMLLRLAAQACAPQLKRAWAAASTRLESEGVTPGAYRSRVFPGATAARANPSVERAGAGAIRQLLAALPGAPAARPEPGAPTPMPTPITAAAAAQSEAALARVDAILQGLAPKTLSKLQAAALTARLDADRSSLLAANASGTEGRQIIEMLGKVFDAMVADPELNPSFIAVIARLQIPAFRLALRDPQAFVSPQYPVWRLLDLTGQASALYPQAADPRGAGLLALCNRMAEELIRQQGATVELCRKALDKLEEFLAAQLKAQLEVTDREVRMLCDAERLETLQQEVADKLAEQMAPLRPSAAVKRFLVSAWARVIANVLIRQSEEEEPARSYIRAVDDVLWSVQSPDHPASRQRLAALRPSMLRCLREGMASIALPEAEQHAILDELDAIHAAALQKDARDAAPSRNDTLDARRADAARRPAEAPGAHDAMIDVGSLETVPAELMPAGADGMAGDAPTRQVAALRSGDRMRMFVNGRWSRVQLLWRSDRGDFLLFAGEAVGDTHSITRRALERLAAAGLLRPIEDQTLSQRAFDAVERRIAGTARTSVA